MGSSLALATMTEARSGFRSQKLVESVSTVTHSPAPTAPCRGHSHAPAMSAPKPANPIFDPSNEFLARARNMHHPPSVNEGGDRLSLAPLRGRDSSPRH